MAFKGKKAISTSLLYPVEKAVADYFVPKVPGFMDTKFLTLTTFLWGALIIAFYYLSKFNKNYLWLVSAVVLFQWLSDILDGGVGRYRNQGLVKWGFFMDHFLDYFFMCCAVIGLYLFIGNGLILLGIISLAGMFFVSVFLRFSALTTFSTSFHGISPAELRVLVMLTNVAFYFLSMEWIKWIFLIVIVTGFLFLVYTIYKIQKEIYAEDMKVLKKSKH